MRSSYNGGKTRTEAKAITDDDPEIYAGKYFPNIAVAANGRIDVACWDTRDTRVCASPTCTTRTPSTMGRPGARTSGLLTSPWTGRLGASGLNYDIASQPGVGSTNAYAIFGWDDTRKADPAFKDNATTGGGLQDVYTAAPQFEALGGGESSAARVILAAVVGLLAVGLLLVAAALVSRGRRSTAPSGEALAGQALGESGLRAPGPRRRTERRAARPGAT